MALRFGTDGLRGIANVELTPALATAVGRAAARHLDVPAFVIGADTRASSPSLKSALIDGITSAGIEVIDVDVVPTPAIAYLAAARNIAGVVISASHNPYTDNGIKLISPRGTKIDDAAQAAIEEELEHFSNEPSFRVDEPAHGKRFDRAELVEDYIAHLLRSVAPPATTMRVVCDCANGASSAIAPEVFSRFGVEITAICASPDGMNINAGCGSTHPERIAKAVLEAGADLGVSFDGDADRLIAVAHDGSIVDGDQLLAMFAVDLLRRGELDHHGVVLTVMSNLGLRQRLESEQIAVIETPVGDRYVADALDSANYVLGGEQSGHIIFRRDATTGDGLLTALKLIEFVARSGRPLAELADGAMTRLPQELRSIRVAALDGLEAASAIWDEVKRTNVELGSSGRVLLRKSGTEPAVRVMVEAESEADALDIVERLSELVVRELGEAQVS